MGDGDGERLGILDDAHDVAILDFSTSLVTNSFTIDESSSPLTLTPITANSISIRSIGMTQLGPRSFYRQSIKQ